MGRSLKGRFHSATRTVLVPFTIRGYNSGWGVWEHVSVEKTCRLLLFWNTKGSWSLAVPTSSRDKGVQRKTGTGVCWTLWLAAPSESDVTFGGTKIRQNNFMINCHTSDEVLPVWSLALPHPNSRNYVFWEMCHKDEDTTCKNSEALQWDFGFKWKLTHVTDVLWCRSSWGCFFFFANIHRNRITLFSDFDLNDDCSVHCVRFSSHLFLIWLHSCTHPASDWYKKCTSGWFHNV